MSKLYYVIQLEDYPLSKVGLFPKTYYGTMENISELIECLAADPAAAWKYRSTIRAFRSYQNGDYFATHTIAGRNERLLTPVKCIHETLILQQNANWHFYNGVYSMNVRADLVDIHQVLLKHEDMYLRCVRPCYENLQFEDPWEGWKAVPNCHHGFPHICATEEGWHYMRLFTLEQVEVEPEPCLARMNDACHVSHREACDDIFGA